MSRRVLEGVRGGAVGVLAGTLIDSMWKSVLCTAVIIVALYCTDEIRRSR